jgi:hypothetical protein
MDMNRSPVRQGTELAVENAKTRIELPDGFRNISGDDPISPLDQFMFKAGTGKIDRATLARPPSWGSRVLSMNHPGADCETGVQDADMTARR